MDAILGAKLALVLSSGCKCLFSIKILEFPYSLRELPQISYKTSRSDHREC